MEDSIQNNNETNAYANHAVWSQSNDYDLSYIPQVRAWSWVLIVWGAIVSLVSGFLVISLILARGTDALLYIFFILSTLTVGVLDISTGGLVLNGKKGGLWPVTKAMLANFVLSCLVSVGVAPLAVILVGYGSPIFLPVVFLIVFTPAFALWRIGSIAKKHRK